MHERSYGIIIHVNDLSAAREFYRDTLKLGAPVIDSNHWIEFQSENGLVIGIRFQPDADKKHNSSVHWIYQTTKYKEIRETLIGSGNNPLELSPPPLGFRAETFADPEGNRFTLAQKEMS